MKIKKKRKTIYMEEPTIEEIVKLSKKFGITQEKLIRDALKALKEKIAGRAF